MWFFTDPHGHQHPLQVTDPNDRAGAERALETLLARMAADALARASPPAPTGPTVAEAAADFLAHCEKKHRGGKLVAASLANYRAVMRFLVESFGPRPLTSLTAAELEDWADRPAWSASSQNARLGMVQTMLRFHRIALAIRRPPRESRGADAVLSDDQFAAVVAAVGKSLNRPGRPGDLAELLRLLLVTGARPQEGAMLTVEGVDWGNTCARLKSHKAKRKTGRDRPLRFNSEAMAILTAQRERYGSGFLFRTCKGRPYSPNAIVRRMLVASERVGFRVTAYMLRHTFATRALANGVPDAHVAKLLGHVGTGMLHFHYSHLGEEARALQEAAERAVKKPPDAA